MPVAHLTNCRGMAGEHRRNTRDLNYLQMTSTPNPSPLNNTGFRDINLGHELELDMASFLEESGTGLCNGKIVQVPLSFCSSYGKGQSSDAVCWNSNYM